MWCSDLVKYRELLAGLLKVGLNLGQRQTNIKTEVRGHGIWLDIDVVNLTQRIVQESLSVNKFDELHEPL